MPNSETTVVLAEKSVRVALRSRLVRMVQAAQDRDGAHAAGQHRARGAPLWGIGHPLPQALMGPRRVEVRSVLPQDAAHLGRAQDHQVVQALAPHAAQEPFARGVLPRCAIRRAQLLDACPGGDAGEGRAVVLADKSIRVALRGWLVRAVQPA